MTDDMTEVLLKNNSSKTGTVSKVHTAPSQNGLGRLIIMKKEGGEGPSLEISSEISIGRYVHYSFTCLNDFNVCVCDVSQR